MRRATARIVTVAAAGAAVVTLGACDKPVPNVTVLSGSTTIVVSPQTYCPDVTAAHCRFSTGSVHRVSAVAGSSLLVDVPREVADKAWSVVSASQKANGNFTTIPGANYASGTITNSHSVRLDVPYGVGSYFLVIQSRSASTNGSWVAEVSISRT